MPRAPKKCGHIDCTERVTGGTTYCPTHTAEQQRRDNTTDRGYGHQHQQARQAALQALRDGTPCIHCGQPMYRSQNLDLDHTADRTAYRGLAHRRCNRRVGSLA
jgi:hypothetical protein